ncbi:MAG: macro domain-containing protein [Sedimentisphaerales bacterium]|nr:macro domain-containing protein [Sedimentisphaerales bacterium]
MEITINKCVLELKSGDITEQKTDAIVNAANCQLVLGGGVAGAIRMKGGDSIQKECSKKGPIDTGQAVITSAGKLKAKHVIHAAGPKMGEGDEDNKLKNATLSALAVANENNLKSIAFPAISTGIFGYPMDKCAKIMLNAVIEYLHGKTNLKKVVFCLYDNDAYRIFANELESRK